ncbi:uncharacterized mitochondrial protein AtMg00810-like [Telopea speciosissima]|uniref:uncharacterized mitochondrial protein AtMg00810-like n=1 Tax=Telopea speciosissima TaxID=54955 RepID=UPI001CC60BBD|nr:uncharacterized mitochondrial protein AtMg00810-like [Telopea speciosissima]
MVTYVLVYVDDILVTGNQPAHITALLQQLASEFSIKDLGRLNFFLGFEATYQPDEVILSQTRYITNLLQRAGMVDCKPVLTPMATTNKASSTGGVAHSDPTQYRSIDGTLQYITLTRPDVAFSVNRVCQFMHNPTKDYWSMEKRILRYLKHTIKYGLRITKSSSQDLQAFTDADWAGDGDDKKSTGGYAIYMGPNLISWASKKQKTVARSSTESEYKALADACAELTWLQSLFGELSLSTTQAPVLWCDNIRATYLSANPVFHACTKHIEIDFHFVRDKVAKKELQVRFISTKDQIANIMTKGLGTTRFSFLQNKLKIRSLKSSS